jgi:hypothetical protein
VNPGSARAEGAEARARRRVERLEAQRVDVVGLLAEHARVAVDAAVAQRQVEVQELVGGERALAAHGHPARADVDRPRRDRRALAAAQHAVDGERDARCGATLGHDRILRAAGARRGDGRDGEDGEDDDGEQEDGGHARLLPVRPPSQAFDTGHRARDTKVTTTGGTLDAEGFETGLRPGAVEGAPAGSPGNASEFVRSEALIDSVASVTTRDTVLLGFGLEQVPSTAERNELIGRALRRLLR